MNLYLTRIYIACLYQHIKPNNVIIYETNKMEKAMKLEVATNMVEAIQF
jgi:hypothetical protein